MDRHGVKRFQGGLTAKQLLLTEYVLNNAKHVDGAASQGGAGCNSVGWILDRC